MKLFGKNFGFKSFNNLKLRKKIVLTVNVLLAVFLIIFGFYLYNYQKNNIIKSTDAFMQSNVSELVNTLQALKPEETGTEQIIINSLDEEFAGVLFMKKNDSLDAFIPRIEIMDKIKKAVGVDIQQVYLNELKQIFDDITYYNSGYPYLLGKNGLTIIHPTLENEDFSDAIFFNKMVSEGKVAGKIQYTWPESRLGEEKVLYYEFYEPLDAYVVASFYESAMFSELNKLKIRIILSIILIMTLFSVAMWYLVKPIVGKINILVDSINTLASGKIIDKFNSNTYDEVGEIMNSVDRLTESLKKNTNFANEIGSGKLDSEFKALSEDDVLGNALLEMRKSLVQNRQEEENRKKEEEKQNWSSRGLAKFNDILRSNDNLAVLGDKITSEMAEYLEANQCGLFVVNEDDENTMDLVSAYAYNRKKYLSKQIGMGEGVAGTCLKEGKTIYLRDVPNDYIQITSGLGQATPRELLVVPLRHEDKILGVFEIASFKKFEKHEIEFVEQVAETIASSVSNVIINQNTNKLLEQARHQAEQLAAQEEEMRQTMEELTATQEEMQRKNKQMEEMNQQFKDNETEMQKRIDEASRKEDELRNAIAEKEKQIRELEKKLGK